MRWLRGPRKQAADQQAAPVAPDPPSPLERSPLTYVVLRIGDRWFTTICADRAEALAVQQALGEDGRYAFAGEAERVQTAHWQLREALQVYWGARGPMPWTALPKTGKAARGNAQLLRTSFEHALNNDPEIVAHFYDRLFHDHPELRDYFPQNTAGLEEALSEKLAEIMLHLEDPDHLRVHLAAAETGRAVPYPVHPEMYGYVKDALTGALADAIDDWDDELQQEWDGALTTVAELMLSGDSVRVA